MLGVIWESIWGHVGVILGSCWDNVGIMLGSCWDHLGSFWNQFLIVLGACRDRSGTMFGAFWDPKGPSGSESHWAPMEAVNMVRQSVNSLPEAGDGYGAHAEQGRPAWHRGGSPLNFNLKVEIASVRP